MRAVALAALLFLLGVSVSWGSATHAKTQWRATVAKLPGNGKQTVSVGSISCGSPGNCSAVGSYGGEGLLLTEKAGHWAAGVNAALPGDANSYPDVNLNSVSCASAGNCTAVGTFTRSDDRDGGLLLTETRGHWAVGVEAVLPANDIANVVMLNSVSCASAGNCTAVGTYDFKNGLVLTEKAGHWARGVEPPLPSDGDGTAVLNSVSCTRRGCSAVGYYNVDVGRVTAAGQGLLLTKKRGKWRAAKAVMPPDGPGEGVVLSSVSCASAGNCGAIGTYNINVDDGYAPDDVLLTQKAGKWHRGVRATAPKDAPVEVSGISCAAAAECVAVGSFYVHSRETWHLTMLTEEAGKWGRGVAAALPRHAPNSGGPAVSCASPGNCTAVGVFWNGSGRHGLLLTEIAGRWGRGVRTPLPTNSVLSVSCASPGNCGAIGGDSHGHAVLLDSTTKRP